MKQLLITGCARSGTTFAARWLSDRGMLVGHERAGVHGISSWCLAPMVHGGRVTMMPGVRLPSWHGLVDQSARYEVLHLVRHPLDTIASLMTIREDSWQWAAQHVELNLEAPLLRAVQYWVRWNALVEPVSGVRIRVEDVQHNYSSQPNARPHAPVMMHELRSAVGTGSPLWEQLWEMKTRYGYSW